MIEFAHSELVKTLELINRYKASNTPFDHNLLNDVKTQLKDFHLPSSENLNAELYLESLFNWPSKRLFTYGTLMPGQINNSILKYTNGFWEDGFVRGELCETGWGVEYGYPGLFWQHKGNIVNGKLLYADEIDLKMLDQLEGKDYERIWVIVHLSEKRIKVANCYTLPSQGSAFDVK